MLLQVCSNSDSPNQTYSDSSESPQPSSTQLSTKPISEHAYTEYNKQNYPKTYKAWGEEWVAKFPEFERKAVQKVATGSNTCDSIDYIALSESKSTPKKEAVFLIDCTNGERFYVSQNELSLGEELRSQSQKAISQDVAYDSCRSMIKASANHPSSVDFKLLDSGGFTAQTTGNVVITLGFTAKNGLGIDIPYRAKCIFTPDGQSNIEFIE